MFYFWQPIHEVLHNHAQYLVPSNLSICDTMSQTTRQVIVVLHFFSQGKILSIRPRTK
jgi:hypothetical protein